MASEQQKAAALYLAANSGFSVKRITPKAVILHGSDPSIRIRVGQRTIWRQHRLESRTSTEWINIAQLKLSTKEMATRWSKSARKDEVKN